FAPSHFASSTLGTRPQVEWKISYHVVAGAIWNLFRKGRKHSVVATALKSAVGQTQKSECATGKSALPSTTGIVSGTCQVRKLHRTGLMHRSKQRLHSIISSAATCGRGYRCIFFGGTRCGLT